MDVVLLNSEAADPASALRLMAAAALVEAALGPRLGTLRALDHRPERAPPLPPELPLTPSLHARLRDTSHLLYEHTSPRLDALRGRVGAWLAAHDQQGWAEAALGWEEHRGWKSDWEGAGGALSLDVPHDEARRLDLRAALERDVPLALWWPKENVGPGALGPEARRLVARCHLIVLESDRHLQKLRAAGVADERAFVAGAGLLYEAAARAGLGQWGQRRPRDVDGAPRVLVALSPWEEVPGARATPRSAAELAARWQAIEALRALARWLDDARSVQVVFFAHDDGGLARRVADGLPAGLRGRLIVDSTARYPARLLRAMTHYDVVITTRPPLAQLATAAGTPALLLADEAARCAPWLVRDLQRADWVVPRTGLSPEALCGAVEEFLNGLPQSAPQAWLRVDALRQRAQGVVGRLATLYS